VISLLIHNGRPILVLVIATLSLPNREPYLFLFFFWREAEGSAISFLYTLENNLELLLELWFILWRRENNIVIEPT
jgi:hypothetical protein